MSNWWDKQSILMRDAEISCDKNKQIPVSWLHQQYMYSDTHLKTNALNILIFTNC